MNSIKSHFLSSNYSLSYILLSYFINLPFITPHTFLSNALLSKTFIIVNLQRLCFENKFQYFFSKIWRLTIYINISIHTSIAQFCNNKSLFLKKYVQGCYILNLHTFVEVSCISVFYVFRFHSFTSQWSFNFERNTKRNCGILNNDHKAVDSVIIVYWS